MRNGKGSVSIPERARRVYSPTKTPGNRTVTSHAQTGTGLHYQHFLLHNKLAFHNFIITNLSVGDEEVQAAEGSSDVEEYNPYLEQEQEQRSLVSSEFSRDEQVLHGLRLDNVEFDEQNLFDNFKPIFNYSAPNTAPMAEDGDDISLEGGKSKAKYGKSVKLKLALEQSVDLLF